MAKDRPEEPRKKETVVLLDPSVARKVKLIAAALDVKIQDWVNNRLSEIVDAALEVAMKEMGLDVKPRR
jgi:hypothetical protein